MLVGVGKQHLLKLFFLTLLLLPWLLGRAFQNVNSTTEPSTTTHSPTNVVSMGAASLVSQSSGAFLSLPSPTPTISAWRSGGQYRQAHTFVRPFSSRKPEPLATLIRKYAALYGIEEKLVWAVMRQESGFNPYAVSPKGAMGLMQLMPATADLMGVTDPFDIEQNIAGGIKFLKICLKRFNNDVVLALAAYNAGPENVEKYNGCPPFAETQNYVAAIMLAYAGQPWAGADKWRAARKPSLGGKDTAPPPKTGLDWKIPPPQWKVSPPQWKVTGPQVKVKSPTPKTNMLSQKSPLAARGASTPPIFSSYGPNAGKLKIQGSHSDTINNKSFLAKIP